MASNEQMDKSTLSMRSFLSTASSERREVNLDRANSFKYGGTTSSKESGNVSTWSQLFLRRNWIDSGFEDDLEDFEDEDEETLLCSEVVGYSLLKKKNDFCNFLNICRQSPYVLLKTLACFILLCGGGFGLVYYFKENSIHKKKEVAKNLGLETASYYRDALATTVMPLFSLGQIVKHDENFLKLSNQIGIHGAQGSSPIDFKKEGFRNVTGICDNIELIESLDSIVASLNKDAHILQDGVITSLQLAPQGVFCLTSPRVNYNDFRNGLYQDMTGWYGKDWVSSETMPMEKMALKETLKLTNSQYPLQFLGPMSIKMKSGEVLSNSMYCVHLSIPSATDKMLVDGEEYGSWGLIQGWINWETLEQQRCMKIDKKFQSLGFVYKLAKHVKMEYNSKNGMISGKTVFRDENGKLLDKADLVDGKVYDHVFWLASTPKFDDRCISQENSLVFPIKTLNSEWTMTVVDVRGFKPSWYNPSIIAVAILSLAFSILFLIIAVERRQHQILLYKMMPKAAIKKLNKGKTVVEKYNMVTIFFSDIVGFTTLASSMRPVEIMRMLNDLYIKFDELVEKHNLYKVETIGDAYMVLGGAPNRNVTAPEAAEKIASFALDAIDVVKNLRIKTTSGEEGKIFIRAGIASGPVVAGVVGNAMPRYCLFGDTVNFASRMESTSLKMRIQCCDTTRYLLANAPNTNFLTDERLDDGCDGRAGTYVKGIGWTHTWWITGAVKRNKYSLLGSRSITDATSTETSSVATSIPSETADVQFLQRLASQLSNQPFQYIGRTNSENKNDMIVPESTSRNIMVHRLAALLQYRMHQLQQSRQQSPTISYNTSLSELLVLYVTKIAELYNEVPYHSLLHASHVTISTNRLIELMIPSLKADPLVCFSLVFAAMIHDVAHGGTPNFVLIKLNDELASKFNNVSILEKNSIVTALSIFFEDEDFKLLREELFSSEEDIMTFKQIITSTVLCTDIFNKERMDKCLSRWDYSFGKVDVDETDDIESCKHVHLYSQTSFDVDRDYINDINELDIDCMCPFYHYSVSELDCLRKSAMTEHLIQVADVAHSFQSWEIFLKFNYRLVAELYSCHKLGWFPDITETWFEGQIKFFDEYAIPLAERFQTCCNKLGNKERTARTFLTDNVKRNRAKWLQEGRNVCLILQKGIHTNEREEVTLSKMYRCNTSIPKLKSQSDVTKSSQNAIAA